MRNRVVLTALSVFVVLGFSGTNVAMAVEVVDGCDVGSGPNDIHTLSASFDAVTDEITVKMLLCDDPNQQSNRTKYRVHFDHTAPFFDDDDRNGDGVVDANDFCFSTSDDTMRRRLHRGSNKDTGPGIIDEDGNTLTYTVAVADLDPLLALGDTVYIWADTRFKGINDRAPNTEGGDGCSMPEVEYEVLALSLLDPTCVVANGLIWCFNDSACGEACNAVCASQGLTPVADSTVWFNAQNDLAECQAISQAFGLGTNVMRGPWFFACLEDQFGPHSAGGGLLSPLFCSTDSECPDRHRTIMDDLGVACDVANSRRSICPCQ